MHLEPTHWPVTCSTRRGGLRMTLTARCSCPPTIWRPWLSKRPSRSGRAQRQPGLPLASKHLEDRLLNHDVVSIASDESVQPRAADQYVIAGSTEQGVIACAADQHIVPVSAVGR